MTTTIEATKSKQLLAVLVDYAAFFLILVVGYMAAFAVLPADYLPSSGPEIIDWLSYIVVIGYFIVPSLMSRGATPGTLLLGMRVVNRRMEPLGVVLVGVRSLFVLIVFSLAPFVLLFAILFGTRTPFDIIFRCRMAYLVNPSG